MCVYVCVSMYMYVGHIYVCRVCALFYGMLCMYVCIDERKDVMYFICQSAHNCICAYVCI